MTYTRELSLRRQPPEEKSDLMTNGYCRQMPAIDIKFYCFLKI